jgi:hypothetical protein
MTPEEQARYEELLRLGGQNEEAASQMKIQSQQAQMLRRNGQMPDMRQAGRLTVAPHWLELVGNLASQKVAGDIDKKMQGSLTEQAARKQQQNAIILRQMMQQAPQQQLTQGIAMPGAQPSQFRLPSQYTGEE